MWFANLQQATRATRNGKAIMLHQSKYPIYNQSKYSIYASTMPVAYIVAAALLCWQANVGGLPDTLLKPASVLCWVAAIAALVGAVGLAGMVFTAPVIHVAMLKDELEESQTAGIFQWWSIPVAVLRAFTEWDSRTICVVIAAIPPLPLRPMFQRIAIRRLDAISLANDLSDK